MFLPMNVGDNTIRDKGCKVPVKMKRKSTKKINLRYSPTIKNIIISINTVLDFE